MFLYQFHSACFVGVHVLFIKDSHGLFAKLIFLILFDLLILFSEEGLYSNTSSTSDSQHYFAVMSKLFVIQLLRVDDLQPFSFFRLFFAEGVLLHKSLSEVSELFFLRLLILQDVALHEAGGYRFTCNRLRFVNHFETLWHFRERRRLQLGRISRGELTLLLHKFMADSLFILEFEILYTLDIILILQLAQEYVVQHLFVAELSSSISSDHKEARMRDCLGRW